MNPPGPDYYKFSLLRLLPPEEMKRLRDVSRWIDLKLHEVLQSPHIEMTQAIFPMEGLVSLLAVTKSGVRVEVGIVGQEGFIGTHLVHEVKQAPFQAIVQVAGRALAISADNLKVALANCPKFRSMLLRFTYVFEIQLSHTALCNGCFSIQKRLARWILMRDDRVGWPNIDNTHEQLSIMLAVRRASITLALNELEGLGIIRCTRAKIEILDRKALLNVAGGAYGLSEAEYRRLIDPEFPFH